MIQLTGPPHPGTVPSESASPSRTLLATARYPLHLPHPRPGLYRPSGGLEPQCHPGPALRHISYRDHRKPLPGSKPRAVNITAYPRPAAGSMISTQGQCKAPMMP
eukprot:752534-Hanusia_phi.AAC.1